MRRSAPETVGLAMDVTALRLIRSSRLLAPEFPTSLPDTAIHAVPCGAGPGVDTDRGNIRHADYLVWPAYQPHQRRAQDHAHRQPLHFCRHAFESFSSLDRRSGAIVEFADRIASSAGENTSWCHFFRSL